MRQLKQWSAAVKKIKGKGHPVNRMSRCKLHIDVKKQFAPLLLYDIRCKNFKDAVNIAVSMNVQVDGL